MYDRIEPSGSAKKRLGKALHTARAQLRLTQAQLAVLCNVEPNTVSQWERGLNVPRDEHLAAIERAIGLDLRDVLRGGQARESTAHLYGADGGQRGSALHVLHQMLEHRSEATVLMIVEVTRSILEHADSSR